MHYCSKNEGFESFIARRKLAINNLEDGGFRVNKKAVIGNTILFIAIVGFIIGFNALFGVENTLIGVATITAMLMLLERDLTIHPISNTFKLISLNLVIGIGAFIADVNMWAGVPITFIIMFVISYSLSYNLRNPLYFPFSLQYLFILAFPVPLDLLPTRLASLIFGAIAIMLLQLLVNKKKLTKSGNKSIQEICSALRVKIDGILNGEPNEESDEQISKEISSLRKMIFDRRADEFYLTEEGKIRLNISAALERINVLLPSDTKNDGNEEILHDLSRSLVLIEECLDDKKKLKDLSRFFDEMVEKYNPQKNQSPMMLKIISNIDFLIGHIDDLHSLHKEAYNLVKKTKQIPEKFRNLTFGYQRHHTNSVKFSFAIRIAIGMSLVGFIVDLFEIHEGRWMMFTLLSLVIPIYEHSSKRVRDRIFATIVGSVLVLIVFNIFQTPTARTLILMTAGYLMTYVKVYRYSTIIVTFSAIGSATLLTGATELLTINRVLLVFAGTAIALIINKFVYPYQMDDANKDLERLYHVTLESMLDEVRKWLQMKGNSHSIKNLFMTTTMIEDRLELNLQDHDHPEAVATWLERKRSGAISIYEMFIWIQKHGISDNISSFIMANSKQFLKASAHDKIANEVNQQMQQTESMEDKILLSMINEMLDVNDISNKNVSM